jgi:hypothetical protein
MQRMSCFGFSMFIVKSITQVRASCHHLLALRVVAIKQYHCASKNQSKKPNLLQNDPVGFLEGMSTCQLPTLNPCGQKKDTI